MIINDEPETFLLLEALPNSMIASYKEVGRFVPANRVVAPPNYEICCLVKSNWFNDDLQCVLRMCETNVYILYFLPLLSYVEELSIIEYFFRQTKVELQNAICGLLPVFFGVFILFCIVL